MVAHTYNLCYLGGGDQEDQFEAGPGENISESPTSKQTKNPLPVTTTKKTNGVWWLIPIIPAT
jgi:hypothetical protein